MRKKMGTVGVVLLFLIGGVPIVSAAYCSGSSWWAPDRGNYLFNTQTAHSWNIRWYQNQFGLVDAYDHEFRTPVTNFAHYTGYCDSNLPWPRRCDVDEPEDDFTIYTAYAHGISTSTYYYTYLELEPEGASSASANLEAETRRYNPWNRQYCDLDRFTAPAQGSWDL